MKVTRFFQALVAFVSDGCALVSKEQYEERLNICITCTARDCYTCGKCGCYIPLKAQARSAACELEKWPSTVDIKTP